ncbi:hypothetical protein M6B38_388760 [Iris pallida]|uniref:Uncharacterized protein n=1 Tax=Iris pallida TaxID=29817 RepID=A0AAX6G1J9_IRIPA|nr:hypothetical protein M6B38_388760 [Iris pallida]
MKKKTRRRRKGPYSKENGVALTSAVDGDAAKCSGSMLNDPGRGSNLDTGD